MNRRMKETQSNAGIDSALQRGGRPQVKYTEEMILRSSSGYCMPFEEPIKQDVQMSLGYGEQKNPVTGETFFHHGIDFSVNHYLLSAVATGTVSAIGSDAEHGIYQTIRYGKYEVTYRHLSNVFANFSQSVKAGQTIAISGDLLHMEEIGRAHV